MTSQFCYEMPGVSYVLIVNNEALTFKALFVLLQQYVEADHVYWLIEDTVNEHFIFFGCV